MSNKEKRQQEVQGVIAEYKKGAAQRWGTGFHRAPQKNFKFDHESSSVVIAPQKGKVPFIKNKFSKQNKSFIGYKSISVLEQRQQQNIAAGIYDDSPKNLAFATKGIMKEQGRFRQQDLVMDSI